MAASLPNGTVAPVGNRAFWLPRFLRPAAVVASIRVGREKRLSGTTRPRHWPDPHVLVTLAGRVLWVVPTTMRSSLRETYESLPSN